MQQSIDHFLNWYFEIPSSGQENGLLRTWRLEAAWNWQTAWSLLLISIFVFLTVLLVRKVAGRQAKFLFGGILTLRLTVLMLLLLLVFQIQLRTNSYSKPTLVILADTSESMSLSDEYTEKHRRLFSQQGVQNTQKSRFEILQKLSEQLSSEFWQELNETFEITVLNFDTNLGTRNEETHINSPDRGITYNTLSSQLERIQSYSPTGKHTDFTSTLDEVLKISGSPPAAIVLFSDGLSTSSSDESIDRVLQRFSRRGIPIFPVGVGSPQAGREIELISIDSAPVGFIGEQHPLHLTLNNTTSSKQEYYLQLTRTVAQEIVLEHKVRAADETELSISIPELKPGLNEFELQITTSPGQRDVQRNRHSIRVWGREAPLKILLIDQIPRWEFRHLKSALERDKNVSLSTWLAEGDPEYSIEDRTASIKIPTDIDAFDGIILGDIDFSVLPKEFPQKILSLLENNGGMMLLSGVHSIQSLDRTSSLADLHPALIELPDEVVRKPMTVHPSSEGKAQRLFQDRGITVPRDEWPISHLYSFKPNVKPAALSLLDGYFDESPENRIPLILSMRYSNGVVLQHLLDDSWRWREIDNGQFYHHFWGQCIRYLCRRKLTESLPSLELMTNHSKITNQETLEINLLDRKNYFRAAPKVIVFLDGPENSIRELALLSEDQMGTNFQGKVSGLSPGDYVLRVPAMEKQQTLAKTQFQVLPVNLEREKTPLDTEFMNSIANATNGQFFFLWDIEKLTSNLPPKKYSTQSQTRIIPLWYRWELITLLLLCLSMEWGLRRSFGID